MPNTTLSSPISLPPEHRGLHRAVVDEVGFRIVNGELRAGDVLVEADLCERFKVSRSGVREAVKVLAAKGMIRSRTRVGTMIQPRSEWSMLDPDVLTWWSRSDDREGCIEAVHEMRCLIEPGAAAWAAERGSEAAHARIAAAFEGMAQSAHDQEAWVARDLEFHLAILEASDNPLLSALGTLIETALNVTFRIAVTISIDVPASLPNHAEVNEAILRRQPDRSRQGMIRVLRAAETALEAARARRTTRQVAGAA